MCFYYVKLDNSSAHFVLSFFGLLLRIFFLRRVWSKSMVSLASQRHLSVIRKYSMMIIYVSFRVFELHHISFFLDNLWVLFNFEWSLKKWFVSLPFIFVRLLIWLSKHDFLWLIIWESCFLMFQSQVHIHVYVCYLFVHHNICYLSVDKCMNSKDF